MKLRRSFFARMDEQVIYTMAGICIISIIVLSFRFIARKPCGNINIRYGTDSIYVNDVVHFTAELKKGKTYSWNFGDGISVNENNASINHPFKEARKYAVKVEVDGECTDIQSLVVYERKQINIATPGPELVAPESAYINDVVTFYDASLNSTSWQWYFEDNAEIYSRERTVKYTFKKPGARKIVLIVNKKSDQKVIASIYISPKPIEERLNDQVNQNNPPARRRNLPNINDKPLSEPIEDKEEKHVVPNPDPPKPDPPKPKRGAEITSIQLEALLFQVSEGKKSAGDFAGYFCDKPDVMVNYDNKQYVFSEFCSVLKQMKKIIKINVFPTKNQNNCILSIQVTIKQKKGPFNLFNKTT